MMSYDPYWDNVVLAMHLEDATDLKGHTSIPTDLAFVPAKFNNGVKATNNSSNIEFADSTDWNLNGVDYTIDFWFNRGANNPYYLISKFDGSNASFYLQFTNDNTLKLSTYSAAGFNGVFKSVISGTIPQGEEVYCALVCSGNVAQWYINGVSSGAPVTMAAIYVSNCPLRVMANGYSGTGSTDYTLDDLRITKGIARDGTIVPTEQFPNSSEPPPDLTVYPISTTKIPDSFLHDLGYGTPSPVNFAVSNGRTVISAFSNQIIVQGDIECVLYDVGVKSSPAFVYNFGFELDGVGPEVMADIYSCRVLNGGGQTNIGRGQFVDGFVIYTGQDLSASVNVTPDSRGALDNTTDGDITYLLCYKIGFAEITIRSYNLDGFISEVDLTNSPYADSIGDIDDGRFCVMSSYEFDKRITLMTSNSGNPVFQSDVVMLDAPISNYISGRILTVVCDNGKVYFYDIIDITNPVLKSSIMAQ